MRYLKDVEELFNKSPVVDTRSIARLIKSKSDVKHYDKLLLHNLLRAGRIKRVTRGFYTTREEPSLAVLCFTPAYLGLQDALSFHNLWEQETIPIIVTSQKARPGTRKVMDANVLIRRLDKKYLFGFDYYKQGDLYLPYSDPEKTIIDILYFRERLDDETLLEAKNRLDAKKLKKYLKIYPIKFRKRVLGLLDIT